MEFFGRIVTASLTALHFHVLRWWQEYAIGIFCIIVFLNAGYFSLLAAPRDFPQDITVNIPKGASLPVVAEELANAHVIAHPNAFILFVRAIGEADHLNAGRYRFSMREDTITVALRLVHADSGIPPIRITFPEGSSNLDVATLVHAQFSDISTNTFLAVAASYEGYLFPDTYQFTGVDTPESIVDTLRNNFDKRIATVRPTITASRHSLGDIITMAALLEAETNTPQDRKIVAGILWNRIKIGMALQVDSAPDTYQHKGLPPTPINNPGLEAITAAALPAKTSYIYYLTGSDGKMHYAVTFVEHQANLKKYLK